MKKYFFTLLTLCVMTGTAVAAEAGDTLVNVRQADEVLLTESDSVLQLRIKGRASDPSYRFEYRKAWADRSESETIECRGGSWDFTFPLAHSRRKSGRKVKHEIHMGGIGFGFVTAPGAPSGMDVDMAASYEILADLMSWHTLSANKRHDFSVGFGIDWRNYRMTGKTCFVKEGNDIVLSDYPDGAEIQFSRIKVFSLTVPFRYQYYFSKHLSASIAAILCMNTYASVKNRYKLDGHKLKDMYKDIHQRPVTVDFAADLRWRDFGIYAKYSPCQVLNTAFGPGFRSLSAGFLLFY